MTLEQLIEQGRLNMCMPTYQRKREDALRVCREQLLTHKRPYLSLSGGKDSVAMAFLADEAARETGTDFTIWTHVSSASFPGTLETCQEVARRLGRKLDVYDGGDAFAKMSEPQRMAFGKSGTFFESVRAYAADKDLSFVGVRAYESSRRMQAAKAHGMVFRSESMGGVDVVNPLQWFRLNDVASLLYEFDAPIHPVYRKFETDTGRNRLGEPHFIRLGYITSRDLLDKGTAVFLQANYPAQFAALQEQFPELRNHV